MSMIATVVLKSNDLGCSRFFAAHLAKTKHTFRTLVFLILPGRSDHLKFAKVAQFSSFQFQVNVLI
jgi:hypothetical protein